MEHHIPEWENYLSEEEIIIETKFRLMDEDLSSTVNPFTKFTFFSILKPHLSDTLITCTIKDIINNEDNPYIINNKEKKEKNKSKIETLNQQIKDFEKKNEEYKQKITDMFELKDKKEIKKLIKERKEKKKKKEFKL